ncbi:hypothetical protein CDV58_03288, partial [Aspergillus fumigatus]
MSCKSPKEMQKLAVWLQECIYFRAFQRPLQGSKAKYLHRFLCRSRLNNLLQVRKGGNASFQIVEERPGHSKFRAIWAFKELLKR